MSATRQNIRTGILSLIIVSICSGLAWAGAHTWKVNEVFSNAAGNIQFIELRESGGGTGEIGVNGHTVASNSKVYTIPGPSLTAPTSFKFLLFATPDFAALPGVPTPDYIIPAGSVPFFATTGDTLRYTPFDATFVFGAGVLPTDGVHSLSRPGLTVGCNSPTNYAGVTGSINLGCTIRGDVDGSGARDGGDISAFVRVKSLSPALGDNPACAEYCTGSLDGDIAAFVADLLS